MPKCKANIDHRPISWFSQLFLSLGIGAYLSWNPVGNFSMSKDVSTYILISESCFSLLVTHQPNNGMTVLYVPPWRAGKWWQPYLKVSVQLQTTFAIVYPREKIPQIGTESLGPSNHWSPLLPFLLFFYSLCGIQSVFCLRPNYVDLPQIPLLILF